MAELKKCRLAHYSLFILLCQDVGFLKLSAFPLVNIEIQTLKIPEVFVYAPVQYGLAGYYRS